MASFGWPFSFSVPNQELVKKQGKNMEYNYEITIRKVESGHQWVMYSKEKVSAVKYLIQDVCFSPVYKTEDKAVIEALLHGSVFGIDVKLPEAPAPVKRHLSLVE